jgi:hypothetical protein
MKLSPIRTTSSLSNSGTLTYSQTSTDVPSAMPFFSVTISILLPIPHLVATIRSPLLRLREGGVDGEFGGIEPAGGVEFFEEDLPEFVPEAEAGPEEEAVVAGAAGRVAFRHGVPADAVAEDVDDAFEAGAVVGEGPAAFGVGRFGGQERCGAQPGGLEELVFALAAGHGRSSVTGPIMNSHRQLRRDGVAG